MAKRYALECAPYGGTNSQYKRACRLVVVLSFASGVPSIVAARSAAGFTITGDTGVYSGVAPSAPRGVFSIQCLTASADAIGKVTSYNPVTGAFAFEIRTANTGAALDVATGDEVWLTFDLEGG